MRRKRIEPSRLVAFIINLFNLLNAGAVYITLQDKKCKEESISDITDYEIIIPERVDKEGLFLPYPVLHNKNRCDDSQNDDYIAFFKLPVEDHEVLVQLKPNKNLIWPKVIFTSHSGQKHRNMKHFKHPEHFNCYYTGNLKEDNVSKVALSTCNGLAGYIQTKEGTYILEPLNHSNREFHVLSKIPVKKFKTRRRKREINDNNKSSNNSLPSHPLYIETLIVVDKPVINYFQEFDCESYILTLFNIASNLLHDASLHQLIILSVVRIIRLEKEEFEISLKATKDPLKTFKNFQEWQYQINPGDDSHPNHHDIAVLLTRINCSDYSTCGLLGITELGAACDAQKSAILTIENGLRTGFYLAHQIAHLLGVEHDTSKNGCNVNSSISTIMHPNIPVGANIWSECSKEYIQSFLQSNLGKCLKDKPYEHNFNTQDLLPGAMFDADFQCRTLISRKTGECFIGSTCNSLNCQIPGLGCIQTKVPPAPGTTCGENMWCFTEKCLMVGERPEAIDGNWGSWSAWSDCSRTCGSGVSSSVRQCNKPVPSHGGKFCVGPRRRYRICATEMCPVGVSFRDLQCKEFNDWIYPEDGKKHIWNGFYYRNENPCKLFCINENQNIVALKPRVIDGTECHRGNRDICVGGKCRSVPCNLEIDSKAIEDVCGVCHGDGTSCEFSQGIQFFEKLEKTWTKLINIHVGTRNINVEELSPTSARIIVRDKETKDVYVRGDTLGMFQVPGSHAWLGMIKSRQEFLKIPDPITKPLSIWIDRSENVTVRWSMALPVLQQRKPEFTWDFLNWGPCSAQCGKGVQLSQPSCIEQKAGLVEESYCADLEMPPPKVRACEAIKCEPRWMVSDWKECKSSNSTEKKRKRKVKCVKSFGEMGESIVADSKCGIPKPHDQEPCKADKKIKEQNPLKNATQKAVPKAMRKRLSKRNLIFQESHRYTRMKDGKYRSRFHHLKYSENDLKNQQAKSESVTEFKIKKIRKGEPIIDRENIDDKEMEIILEENEKGEVIKIDSNLIQIPKNSLSFTIRGKKIYELLKKLREKN